MELCGRNVGPITEQPACEPFVNRSPVGPGEGGTVNSWSESLAAKDFDHLVGTSKPFWSPNDLVGVLGRCFR